MEERTRSGTRRDDILQILTNTQSAKESNDRLLIKDIIEETCFFCEHPISHSLTRPMCTSQISQPPPTPFLSTAGSDTTRVPQAPALSSARPEAQTRGPRVAEADEQGHHARPVHCAEECGHRSKDVLSEAEAGLVAGIGSRFLTYVLFALRRLYSSPTCAPSTSTTTTSLSRLPSSQNSFGRRGARGGYGRLLPLQCWKLRAGGDAAHARDATPLSFDVIPTETPKAEDLIQFITLAIRGNVFRVGVRTRR
ncbi:hypothetical protein BC938DRAFT_474401 [Jimgerdemannia flammicorona]|uniref:Uncharacterized protein n=1 Tax=Jimgerdemannia flammicorona TaxID=994334 RepID=A0A433QZI5_9FUNG|nr:hypothetical protein BC938DRAFT_474401 [Jimgerdemannia flammicorona]